jgi:hypothetical protein
MAYKSKKPKKENETIAFLRKKREEEHAQIIKHDEVGFRRLEKTRRGNR